MTSKSRSRSKTKSRLHELPIVKTLLASKNPSVVYKVRVNVLDESPDSPRNRKLRNSIKTSAHAKRLLSHRQKDGTIVTHPSRPDVNTYKKWQGPHWTLVCLAELEYPPGDRSLAILRDQFLDSLFSEKHMKMPSTLIIEGQEDRVRRCASQEGYAVWYSLKLGMQSERTDELVSRLRKWQWPDGGWNCDKRPEAGMSSVHESLIPMRALWLHGQMEGSRASKAAARKTADVFLSRKLYKMRRDGTVIHPDFTKTQFPYFYQYNILSGLKVMAEAGFTKDKRCRDALDLLESKRLPDGGFPLEKRNYKTTDDIISRGTFADWGASGKKKMNEFVTADSLHILKSAGRL
jgi:hypothetical protein